MSDNIGQLQAAMEEARDRHYRAQRVKETETESLLRVERDRIHKLMDAKHDAAIAAAHERFVAANDAHLAALEARALTGEGAPYPLGTRLVEWDLKKWTREWVATGRVGVVEAVTRTTEHPDSLAHGRARIGDYVVRILKKGGTPSKLYVNVYWRAHWLPEGVKHPSAK